MSTKKMLIDGAHAEETRVVIVSGNRLEDFDVEVESRRQLKGNIYLAKVTRVEPSLQAAFVDFGGNRHGFLAFSEIHPDYYQIPVADRAALLEEQRAAEAEAEAAEQAEDDGDNHGSVETVGGNEVDDEVEVRRSTTPVRRNYKIQEVIKRRQILLVQVVKEERGNKGAALTTYVSLPGRYCVLMPNTARGGGVSRKIANGADRRKLKTFMNDLDIPTGMAVIVRTAGAKRTKAEIKRDYEYLLRLWTQIRDTTMESIAPCLIYEEGNLIKRAIRDLYTKDIDEIIIEGTEAYRMAKDFMKLLIPSHAKRVQPYKEDDVPLFHRYQVESQLDAMHDHVVPLRSGGYLVLNQTEALVAVDVNSGKATRERNIEETALNTNMEAADEIARQLRLRDLAGLVVIDFIDMEVNRNNSRVERQLKEAMKTDRARIQIGRISPFGLLELSRQRLRPSLMETSSEPCAACGGTGHRRSVGSAALSVVRAIEEEALKRRSSALTVYVAGDVALYILNHKRAVLADIEQRYEIGVTLEADDTLIPPDHRMERVKSDGEVVEEVHDAAARTKARASDESRREDDGDGSRKRRRRRPRRGRRGGENDAGSDDDTNLVEAVDADGSDDQPPESAKGGDDDSGDDKPKRRRGRRGGRRRSRKRDAAEDTETKAEVTEDEGDDDLQTAPENAEDKPAEEAAEPADSGKKRARRPRKSAKAKVSDKDAKAEDASSTELSSGESEKTGSEASSEPAKEPDPSPASTPIPEPAPLAVVETDKASSSEAARTTVIVVGEGEEKQENARRGWWRRNS
ncbi:MAG: Rne/Rng family ribonuclease [Rhodospirillales bacterium]